LQKLEQTPMLLLLLLVVGMDLPVAALWRGQQQLRGQQQQA
jgi:hypothetical protein